MVHAATHQVMGCRPNLQKDPVRVMIVCDLRQQQVCQGIPLIFDACHVSNGGFLYDVFHVYRYVETMHVLRVQCARYTDLTSTSTPQRMLDLLQQQAEDTFPTF